LYCRCRCCPLPLLLQVRKELRGCHFHVDADVTDRKMQKKVREAQLAQYNYILVVGEQEKENKTVNVRTRDNVVHGMHTVSDLKVLLAKERDSRSLTSAFAIHADGEQQQQQPAADS
jgi:threonyl-tRNA synthetase